MATSEIEKLERRYAENPHGLTFAPLAEVHRKIGDVPRALELLTAGLELHPNYIPASIVLGRCHQDQGNLPAAEAAFAHVLRLDDENVIALKSLADINERQERYAEAETWLRRLVAIDRSNDEAREQLERVEAARQSGAVKEAPASVLPEPAPLVGEAAVVEEGPVAEEAPAVLEMIDLTPEPVAVQAVPAAADAAPPPAEVVPVKVEVETEILAAEPAPEPEPEPRRPDIEIIYEPPEPAQVVAEQETARPAEVAHGSPTPDESGAAEEVVQPLPGLISAEFQPPLEATGGLGVETSEDVVLEVSGNSEFSVPDASEDLKSVAARLSSPRAPTPTQTAETEFTPPAPVEPPSKADAAPEFVLTETMAEVLAAQGHSEDALRIYRELMRRNGQSSELEARIRELESGPVGLSQQSQSYRARDTNGQSVGAFFRAMLAARVGGAAAANNHESTGRNESAGQNGATFLESSYSEEQGLPVPPAVPSEAQAESAVSFDDFFNSEPDGSTPSRQGKGEAGKDDLDQFQTWLQNLKR